MDRYMEFGAIKQLLCFFNNEFIQPPFSKGEIFKHTQLNALEKRNLFKLLQNFLSHFHKKLNFQVHFFFKCANSLSERTIYIIFIIKFCKKIEISNDLKILSLILCKN